ncbi:hypothetical protein H3V53_35390 [Paraburkholderia bengalensis]|uniref:Uncharacterized protein n=1 Tax=Paraburkholderia bengalensis TaxID=2747562 RepID=A0ABU8J3D4_9BURK
MSNAMHALRVSRMTIGAIVLLSATAALAGGNGNGGTGSGGAHGAATSGMTYHSEPVSSPWGRAPGQVTKNTVPADDTASALAPRGEDEQRKVLQ